MSPLVPTIVDENMPRLSGLRFAEKFASIQDAIADAGTDGSVVIPSNYARGDSFTNPSGVAVLDLRQTATRLRSAREFGALGDGVTDDAAALNTGLAALAAAGGGVLYLPAGTYIIGSTLNMPTTAPVRLCGAGQSGTVLKLKNGANVDVVSQANFGALTGTASSAGVFHISITDLTIDGNKANNASGWGVRLFGRATLMLNLTIQNCASGGQWSEGNDTGAFATPADDLESYFINLKHLTNGGNGLTFKGPHDSRFIGMINWGNAAWGHEFFKPAFVWSSESYLNGSGGMHVAAGGAIVGTNNEESSAAGWGCLIDTGSGSCQFAGALFAGAIALEVRSVNHAIQGTVCNTPTTAVKLNGGSGNFQLTMFGNAGTWFDVNAQNGASIALVQGMDGAGTLFSGTPAGHWFVDGAKSYNQLNSGTIVAAGWSPVLPQTNQSIAFAGANAPAYGATVNLNAYDGAFFTITPNNGNAFTIAAPGTPAQGGQLITIRIKNTFGALGVATFTGGAGGFRLGAAWAQPANGFSRSITFMYDGANWIEVTRAAADVAN